LNELISNALKYGFPSGRKGEGKIEVTLRRAGGREVELAVKDNGVGLPADFNIGETKSLGLKIIKLLVEDQLGGDLKIVGNGGTSFFVKFGIAA
jgi:two-component sensor histidine kinase